MKLSPEFIGRDIAGELVIVPIGEKTDHNIGLISANELGTFIWQRLEKGKQIDQIVAEILNEFDVDEFTAKADTEQFINELKRIGAVIE